MQVLFDIPESKRPGITAARLARNASLPAEVAAGQQEDGTPITAPNPDLIASDEDYLVWVVGKAVDSYNASLPAAPAPAPSPDPVSGQVMEVSARQAHEELFAQGLHDLLDPTNVAKSAVQACITAIPDPTQRAMVHNLFHKSAVFRRSMPELVSLWTMAAPYGLGRTLPELDATFTSASQR